MSKSPGHQKWPNHRIQEELLSHGMKYEIDGELVAESNNVIRVDEDEHPTRYYFPRSDVRMKNLERTDKTTYCPFKGRASYYTLKVGDKVFEDAAWTYEDPYEEHRELQNRLAFYNDRILEGQIYAEVEAA
jgi:uncharacterized protein (DUF427 family)